MSEEQLKIEVGKFLRNLRLSKGLTAHELSNKMSYSQGHISGTENGKKVVPTKKFLTEYLNNLSNSTIEYNAYVDQLKSISKNINIDKIEVNNDDEEQLLKELDTRHIMYIKNPDGSFKRTYCESPVNDLSFHLNDRNNTKFYGTIELDKSDINLIDSLIAQVLKSKLENEKAHLKEIEKYEDKIFELKGKEFTPDTDIPKYAEDEHRINEGLEFLKNRGV